MSKCLDLLLRILNLQQMDPNVGQEIKTLVRTENEKMAVKLATFAKTFETKLDYLEKCQNRRKLKKKWRKQQRTKLSISKLSIELTGLVGRLRVEEKELSFHPQGSIHLKAPLRGVSMEELQSAPHPTNVLNQSGGSSSSSRNSQGIRLPKISPQKFREDMRNFQPFWQNLSLTDFHKLTYLVKSARTASVQSLGKAWNYGRELWECRTNIEIQIWKVTTYYKRPYAGASDSTISSKRKHCALAIDFDNITVHVRGLESLGIPAEKYLLLIL